MVRFSPSTAASLGGSATSQPCNLKALVFLTQLCKQGNQAIAKNALREKKQQQNKRNSSNKLRWVPCTKSKSTENFKGKTGAVSKASQQSREKVWEKEKEHPSARNSMKNGNLKQQMQTHKMIGFSPSTTAP